MEEIWKDICFTENGIAWAYRGLYQVSNLGNIKSLARIYYSGANNNTMKCVEEHLVKQGIRSGYMNIRLSKNGKEKSFQVHRLVAHMFVDGYFDGAEVDHINTNPIDNHSENLRWVTRKENQNNPLTRNKNSETKKNQHKGKNNPTAKQVAQYDLNGNLIKVWDYAKEITNTYNWNYNTFYAHLSGNLKCKNPYEYKGFVWKYFN